MTQRMYDNEVIWIIGASSGIGAALAYELAQRGARLALSARRKEALSQLQQEIAHADRHRVFPLDVTNPETTQRTAQAISASFGRIDRVIFLAAAYAPMTTQNLDLAVSKEMIDVNLMGAFHVVHAVLPIFKAQNNQGQLALCASVAGYVGLPGGQPYSATKAALMNLAESLYAEHKNGIDIKLISPGFVRTALTDKNDFPMPMMISPESAAQAIADGLIRPAFEIHFPKKMTLALKFLRLLPYQISLRITRKMTA
jgi:short-subunit dehydrogenase